jgi:hypothetical protein
VGQVLFRRPPVRTGLAPFSASGSPAVVTCSLRLASACRVHAGFSVTVSAFCITHTSRYPVILRPPGPLRPAGGFPALPGGALLPRLLRGLCHRGTRVRQVIPRSSLSYVLARRRPPTHLLGCPRWASPRHWRCARTQRHAGAVPGTGFMRLSGGGKGLPRLEIRVQAIQL